MEDFIPRAAPLHTKLAQLPSSLVASVKVASLLPSSTGIMPALIVSCKLFNLELPMLRYNRANRDMGGDYWIQDDTMLY